MAFLSIRDVCKSFVPGEPILDNFSLNAAAGEVVCLLGASGCGKTTLLRLVAGLEEADAGSLQLQGRNLQEVPVHRRRIGLMFQQHVLFPHLRVGQNIAYGLRRQGWKRNRIRERVEELLDLVRLKGYAERDIQDLSGGEAQRVALARSLAPHPRMLLLDEPLASLDRVLRDELAQELRQVLASLGITSLYVTHDQEEAIVIADRIAFMHGGRVEREDAPDLLHARPGTYQTARFLRFRNLISLRQGGEDVPPWLGLKPDQAKGFTWMLVRPDCLKHIGRHTGDGIEIRVRMLSMTFRGRYYELLVEAQGAGEAGTGMQLALEIPAGAPSDALGIARDAVGDSEALVSLMLNPEGFQLLTG